MPVQPAVAVESDGARNILFLRFRGQVTAADLLAQDQAIAKTVAAMKPAFTVFTDLTDLEAMDIDCVSELTKSMDRFLAGAAGRIVRVIPDPNKDIGFNLLSLTHYRGRVPILTFDSLEEAIRVIAPT